MQSASSFHNNNSAPLSYAKQSNKQELHQVNGSNSAHHYSNANQVNLIDVYHPDSADSNKENEPHAYFDLNLPVQPNAYDSFISPKHEAMEVDSPALNLAQPSSLDVLRQDNLLKRPRDEKDESSQKTKYPRGKNDSSVKSQTIHSDSANATDPDEIDVDATEIIAVVEPTFSSRARREGTVVLDKELLDDFSAVRKYWLTNQRTELGMSSAEVLHAYGIDTDGVMWHILHLIAFSMGGYDGVEPNEIENFTNGTAGSNGFHLRIEDAIKGLVRKHGALYVHYFFEPNQSELDKKWRVGDFTYEFGVIKDPKLIPDFRAGKVEADQIRGECVNSMVIRTLDKRFSSLCDANYLYVAGDVAITRIAEKKRPRTEDSVEAGLPPKTKKFRPSWFLSQPTGGIDGYVSKGSPETKRRLRDRLGSPLKPVDGSNGSKAQTKTGEILNCSLTSKAIDTYTRNAIPPQICQMRSVNMKIDFDQFADNG